MPDLGNVMIAIKAVDEASGVMDKIRASTSILAGAFQNMGGAVGAAGNVMQGMAAGGVAGALTAAVGETTKALKWCVGEAAASEQAIKNLSIAVEKSGIAWDSVKEGTLSALSNLQKFTVYSDEQLAATLQRLLTFGMPYEDAMKAVGTATDLAAAKNIDLESAAGLVGKAFMGNTAILQRYGIDIQTSKEATTALKDAVATVADAIKIGGDNLAGFSDVLGTAGVTIKDTEGKMRGAKEIAQDLIGAFQSGVIDAEAFDQIMGELGVTIDTSKLKAADFPAVMAALNEQFGGTAQEQAKTYEGIQKRLANATSDLGEKIGGMLLPALSSITESMIPVVDWFGQAVDRAQGFLTEMGKMPEVQGIMDGLGEAFSGVGKYLADLQQFMLDAFGPALQELLGAFRELWDALSPIGEALGEIFAAMTGGQGDFDLFKAAIQFVVDSIHRFVEVVKIVAPYIKQFAEAFKAAADFIVPILKGIHDAITGFVDGLKNAFQGFYTWLVGGSLWDDLWNRVGDIARNAGTVIAGIVTGMFTVLNGVFQGGIDLIGTILTAGFSLAFAAVQTIITGATNVLSGLIGSIQKLIQGTTKDWGDLVSTVSTTLGTLRDTISAFWTWTLDYWKNAVNQLVTITQPALDAIQASTRTFFDWSVAKFTEALTVLSNLWQTAWMQVETIVSDTYANIQGRSTAWWSMLQESFMTGLTNITEAWQISWTAILGIAASIWAHIETLLTTWFAQVATLFTANLATLLINWQTGWMSVQMSAVDICGQIMAGLTSWYQLIQDTTTGNLTSLTGTFQNMLSGISGIFTSTFSGMISSAQSSMSAIVSSVASALAQVQAMAAEMSAAMVGHSIWTGMLDEMQAQTTSALGNIVGDFQGMSLAIPAAAVPYSSMQPMTSQRSRSEEVSPLATMSRPMEITTTIPVTIDGELIYRIVNKKLVERSMMRRY